MKTKILVLLFGIKNTLKHLATIVAFVVILILANIYCQEKTTLINILIGIVSGLIASYLFAFYDIIRNNGKATARITRLLSLFITIAKENISSLDSNFVELYKIFTQLCVDEVDLCYKSNLETIREFIFIFLSDIDKKTMPQLRTDLEELNKHISCFNN